MKSIFLLLSLFLITSLGNLCYSRYDFVLLGHWTTPGGCRYFHVAVYWDHDADHGSVTPGILVGETVLSNCNSKLVVQFNDDTFLPDNSIDSIGGISLDYGELPTAAILNKTHIETVQYHKETKRIEVNLMESLIKFMTIKRKGSNEILLAKYLDVKGRFSAKIDFLPQGIYDVQLFDFIKNEILYFELNNVE